MEPHHQQALRSHLNGLSATELANVKSHADAATHEEHESFTILTKYLKVVLGIGVLPAAGLVWKAIKQIQSH